MSYDLTDSCLTFTYSLSSPVTLPSGTFPFAIYSRNTQSKPFTMELSSTAVSDLVNNARVGNKWCTDRRTIASTPITDGTYTLGDANLVKTFSEFTITDVCSDISWSYWSRKVVSGVDQTLNSFISQSANTFNIQSNNLGNDGTYLIKVYGQIPNEEYVYTTFTLVVIDPCPNLIINPGTISSP